MKRSRLSAIVRLLLFALAFTLVPLLLVDAFGAALRWHAGVGEDVLPLHELRRTMLIIGVIQAVILGAAPVFMAHPVWRPSYLRWLMTTPWEPGRPLPLGSVYPGWETLTILAMVAAAAHWLAGANPLIPLIGFSTACVAATMLTIVSTGQPLACFALLGGLVLSAALQFDPPAVLPIAAALLALSFIALRASLQKFPWGMDDERKPPRDVGWPFNRLAPVEPQPAIPTPVAWGLSLLGGWCILVATVALREAAEPAHKFVAIGALALAGGRIIHYVGPFRSPISLLGRLRTGILILPRYDVVFIAPAITLALGAAALLTGWLPWPWSPAALGAVSTAIVAVTLLMGPSLGQWALLGGHHIARMRESTGGPSRTSQPGRTDNKNP